MTPQAEYASKKKTLADAQALIHSGDIIAVSGAITEPVVFLNHLQDIIPRLEGVTLIKSKDNDYAYLRDPETAGHVLTLGHFYHTNFREGHALGITSYLPSDLHNYMSLRTAYKPNNVFIAKVTDMDENGNFQIPYCQMFEREALACAKTVILEINPRFRRVRGGVEIPIERVTCCYTADSPILTIPRSKPSPTDEAIGAYIADMIHDGDTFQLGIGGLPDAVGKHLFARNDLGIHSELFSSTMADLIEQGNDPVLAEILSAAVQMYNLVLNVSGSIGCRSLNLTALGLLPVRGLVHHRGLLRLGSGHFCRRVVHCTGRGIGHVGSHCGNRQSAEHQHRREQDRKESGKFLFHGLLALLY